MTDTLGEVGERAALARIIPRLRAAEALVGPGDDAALVAAPDGRVLLSTDAMVEGPDFRRAWSTPFELGWKAVATNVADIAAMGGVTTGLLVALGAPGSTPVADLERIADGMAAACAALVPGIGVVGGDLTVAPVLSLAVTVTGSLEGGAPVLRSGARAGDTIAYSGRLGLAAAALRLLFATGEHDGATIERLRRERRPLLVEQLAPSPPVRDGVAAARAGASAMLDVSDGLLLDATRIAEASGVVLDLDGHTLDLLAQLLQRKAPELDRATALRLVLGGGEDHGLLATFPGAVPEYFIPLGTVRAGSPAVLIDGVAAAPEGWDSFLPSTPAAPADASPRHVAVGPDVTERRDGQGVLPAWTWDWSVALDLDDTTGWALLEDLGLDLAMAFIAGPGNIGRRPTDDGARSVHVVWELPDGGTREEDVPFTAEDRARMDEDVDDYLAVWGIPPRPSGYDWFVRMPAGETDPDAFATRLSDRMINLAQMKNQDGTVVAAELYRGEYPDPPAAALRPAPSPDSLV